MHYTLHLTNECNLKCHYCYVHKQAKKQMTVKTARAAIDFAARNGKTTGISFFGGEPLLRKELIADVVDYAKKIDGRTFSFKITTNGTLLDEDFLKYCTDNRIMIAISVDGTKAAHDKHRIYKNGAGSYEKVKAAAELLLKYQPYACAMMVINPDTVGLYADGVQKLFDIGFAYYICSLNFDKAANWEEKHFDELKRQFDLLSRMYINWTRAEEKFYFSPFEVKMRSHIDGEQYCAQRCRLGQRQLSVDTDGRLYPCVQFVGDARYCIGDIRGGTDETKRRELFEQAERTGEECARCAINRRCNHNCGCLNKQATGSIDGISPVLCMHEQLALFAADKTAETLISEGNSLFLQKQYNDMYPLLSLIEDRSKIAR